MCRELHAAVLPMLAFVASFDEPDRASRARVHLDALLNDTAEGTSAGNSAGNRYQPSLVESVAVQLRNARGTLLEPFHCPAELSEALAAAACLLAPEHPLFDSQLPKCAEVPRGTDGDGRVPLVIMNHGIRSAWCGVSVTRRGAQWVSMAEMRAHIRWQHEHQLPHERSPHPRAVGLELIRTLHADLRDCSASFDTSGMEPAITIPLGGALAPIGKLLDSPSHRRGSALSPTLHFAHGDPSGRISGGQIPPLVGEFRDEQVRSERGGRARHSLRFRLNPTTLLRLAALPGAKRFVARIGFARDCDLIGATIDPPPAQIIAGSFDPSGVRAVAIPWSGWAMPAAELMPAVPFCADRGRSGLNGGADGDTPCAGSFESLVDLLLALATPYSAPPAPAPKSRKRASAACTRSVVTTVLGHAMAQARKALRA